MRARISGIQGVMGRGAGIVLKLWSVS